MGANVTIYCLEKLTDYFEFERLSHDLMAKIGYTNIEPLGGFQDKGRDAIHIDQSSKTTIFAYSVREDWRAKLAEDAAKIKKHGHTCHTVIFVTTADFSASERDEAVNSIQEQYGWILDIYGVERLRILLEVTYPELRQAHPQIFPPDIIAFEEKLGSTSITRHVFISYGLSEQPLVDWLARKLTAEGYSVWWEHGKHLGQEPFPVDIDEALRTRVAAVIAVFSAETLTDPEAVRHRAIAFDVERQRKVDLVVPLIVGIGKDQLDRHSASLKLIPFDRAWLPGLEKVIERLTQLNCPKPIINGKELATSVLLQKNPLNEQPETVIANWLPVLQLPDKIKLFTASKELTSAEVKPFNAQWSFRRVNSTKFLSFHTPRLDLSNDLVFSETEAFFWRDLEKIEGIIVNSLVSELIRKALIVKCHERGLQYCETTRMDYFPDALISGNRLNFTKPDGSKSHVLVVGQRTLWRPRGSQKYHYQLAPSFNIHQHLFDPFTVLVHLRVRFTTEDGKPLVKRNALSRRKHLTRDWWNNHWLYRLIAICQYLGNEERIIIGTQNEEQIVISSRLQTFSAPVSIDEKRISADAYERSEYYGDDEKDENLTGEETEATNE